MVQLLSKIHVCVSMHWEECLVLISNGFFPPWALKVYPDYWPTLMTKLPVHFACSDTL